MPSSGHKQIESDLDEQNNSLKSSNLLQRATFRTASLSQKSRELSEVVLTRVWRGEGGGSCDQVPHYTGWSWIKNSSDIEAAESKTIAVKMFNDANKQISTLKSDA